MQLKILEIVVDDFIKCLDADEKFFCLAVTETKTKIMATLSERLKQLRRVYDDGFAFPAWVIESDRKLDLEQRQKYHANVVMWVDDDQERVSATVFHREPCNIGMDSLFDGRLMHATFGYSKSFYRTYFERTGRLAPNFGIYTLAGFRKSPVRVHLFHAIGLAFDSPLQPDYLVMRSLPKEAVQPWAQRFYERVFLLVLGCAQFRKLNAVALPMIGGGHFATLYEDDKGEGQDHFRLRVWLPALVRAWQGQNLRLDFLGNLDREAPELWAEIRREWPAARALGNFPDQAIAAIDVKKTLMVNPWDPHSVIGNGNEQDASLDGVVGRLTDAAVIGTALLNPWLLRSVVRVQEQRIACARGI